MDYLEMPVDHAKGVGSKISEMLSRMDIYSIGDLLTHFPRSYQDRSNLKPVTELEDHERAAIIGEVALIDRDRYTKTHKCVTRIMLRCGCDFVVGVWYNQRYVKKNFRLGQRYLFYGEIRHVFTEVQIANPEYERLGDGEPEKIMPVYPATKNLSQKVLRNIIRRLLLSDEKDIPETLPDGVRERYSLCGLYDAFRMIHFPSSRSDIDRAQLRIKFEELLVLQLGLITEKRRVDAGEGISFPISDKLADFVRSLPFQLTGAQKRTVNRVLRDMKSGNIMNRLIQGDVGSGKTIVAVIAIFNAVMNGYQAAMMAPTDILASQDYESLKEYFNGYGIDVVFLSSKVSKQQKERIKEGLKTGEADVVVGTHALIQDDVEFMKLGLVVTDEQHRFGVRQRALLSRKGNNPDVLVMTATPIPRTMALFVYGDLDISVIDELPPGRQEVDTYVVRPNIRRRVYEFVRRKVLNGEQAYVVCPLIDESEVIDAESAVATAEKLQSDYLEGINVGLLHGKMKPDEKEKIMADFKEGRTSVLVSTTVIEVGINVPNATIMVVENADRFGLAELHQLRGRVGRSKLKSYCILISMLNSDISKQRMAVIKGSCDGFEIARRDMELRGTGEFFGMRQSGLPELKLADLFRDGDILKATNELAESMVDDGYAQRKEFKNLKDEVQRKFRSVSDAVTFN